MSCSSICPQEYIRTAVSAKKAWEQEDPPEKRSSDSRSSSSSQEDTGSKAGPRLQRMIEHKENQLLALWYMLQVNERMTIGSLFSVIREKIKMETTQGTFPWDENYQVIKVFKMAFWLTLYPRNLRWESQPLVPRRQSSLGKKEKGQVNSKSREN